MSVTHKLFCVLFALLAPIILTSATSSAQSSPAVAPLLSAPSDQKAGSVLVYNYFGASATTAEPEETLINLTNNHASHSAAVHLFIVDGSSGAVKDSFVTLSPNQTYSLLASSLASRFRGYLIAVAVDSRTGCPTSFNHLTGDAYVRIASGHTAVLSAVAFAALYQGNLANCGLRTTTAQAEVATAQLDLDGISYDMAGGLLGLDSFRHPHAGSSTLLIVNRLGGDLAQGLRPIGDFHGAVYNPAGEGFRFTGQAGPQLRQELGDLLSANPNEPQTNDRLARLQLRAAEEVALTGAAISLNRNTDPSPTSDAASTVAPSPVILALNGGRNLRYLAPAKASFIIPVTAPPIDPGHEKSADVAISMTVSPNSEVTADEELTFTITITNQGPDAAESVVVHDALPSALKLVSCTATGNATGNGVCGGERTSPTITFASLDAGASATITLVTQVLPEVADPTSSLTATGQVIANVATVESATPDPNQSNNKAGTRVMNAAADVAITMTAVPNPIAPGAELTFTITVTNQGPQAAQKVTVTDSLPSSVTMSSCAATGGGVCGGTRTDPIVTFASLEVGASAIITLVTQVNADAPANTALSAAIVDSRAIINTALVRSATFDPTHDNNLAVVRVALALSKPFAVAGTVSNGAKGGLGRVKLTFTVVSGNGTAPAPVATDAFGRWNQSGFQAGTVYRVTPSQMPGCTAFTPISREVKEATRGVDFTTTCR